MAFTDAVFDGSTKLHGVFACRIDTLDCSVEFASGRLFIPVVTDMFEAALAAAGGTPLFALLSQSQAIGTVCASKGAEAVALAHAGEHDIEPTQRH
jgi:hypothetical protein